MTMEGTTKPPPVRLALDRGIVRGYASLFGRLDLSGDRVEPGAFAASLARRGAGGVRMLWQHDAREPIGHWTSLREDRRGLFVEGQLAEGTARGRDVAELIRTGAVDGLSIGFRARRAARDPGTGIRRLLEIDLWEISVVTFPMQELARIAETRGAQLATRLVEKLRAGALALAGPSARPA